MIALRRHWPEYAIEGVALALFMVSALTVTTLFQHPASPLGQLLPQSALGRLPIGLAMGLTAIGLIYSPFGQRSGAHMNPAVTLTFLRLGKIAPLDAAGYVLAQFAGAIAGTAAALIALRGLPADPSVNFAVTMPGMNGAPIAFLAEMTISFALMLTVLVLSNDPARARYTGLAAGTLVAIAIAIEAPLSGMSMNPARTLGSAVFAHTATSLWVYFSGPLVGMLSAAELFVRTRGVAQVHCAKLHHGTGVRCIFRCAHSPNPSETPV